MFSEILESSTGRSVIGMSLLFAWVYISDYFDVIPFVAMTVQILVRLFIFFPRRRRLPIISTTTGNTRSVYMGKDGYIFIV